MKQDLPIFPEFQRKIEGKKILEREVFYRERKRAKMDRRRQKTWQTFFKNFIWIQNNSKVCKH
jgi:hypothetical protein